MQAGKAKLLKPLGDDLEILFQEIQQSLSLNFDNQPNSESLYSNINYNIMKSTT